MRLSTLTFILLCLFGAIKADLHAQNCVLAPPTNVNISFPIPGKVHISFTPEATAWGTFVSLKENNTNTSQTKIVPSPGNTVDFIVNPGPHTVDLQSMCGPQSISPLKITVQFLVQDFIIVADLINDRSIPSANSSILCEWASLPAGGWDQCDANMQLGIYYCFSFVQGNEVVESQFRGLLNQNSQTYIQVSREQQNAQWTFSEQDQVLFPNANGGWAGRKIKIEKGTAKMEIEFADGISFRLRNTGSQTFSNLSLYNCNSGGGQGGQGGGGKPGGSGNETSDTTPVESESSVAAVPNPFRENLRIYIQNGTDPLTGIQLFDPSGRLVRDIKVDREEADHNGYTLSGEGLENGLYFLTVQTMSGQKSIVKVVKTQ